MYSNPGDQMFSWCCSANCAAGEIALLEDCAARRLRCLDDCAAGGIALLGRLRC